MSWTEIAKRQDIPRFMALRKEIFPTYYPDGIYPPNTLLIVDRLVKEEFEIEVEAIVAVDR